MDAATFLLLLLILVAALAPERVTEVRAQTAAADEAALLYFLGNLTSTGTGVFSTWTTATSLCAGWNYVTCNGNGRVNQLTPTVISIAGPIAPALFSLDALTNLQLQVNALTGTLPTMIAHLTNLVFFNCGNNAFAGPIPSELGLLTSLTYLHLDTISWTGAVPSQLGQLTNLQDFRLGTPYQSRQPPFGGTLPSQIGNLVHLSKLTISSSLLTGTIPSQIETLCQSIKSASGTVTFGCNGFLAPISGACTTGLSSCSSCYTSGGWTSASTLLQPPGQCAPVDAAALLSLLAGFTSVGSGSFTAWTNTSFPCTTLGATNWPYLSCSALGRVTSLSLDSLNLAGTVSTAIAALSALQYFDISFNSFNTGCPTGVAQLTTLTHLDLSYSGLCMNTPFPTSYMNLTQLNFLNLDGCVVSGSIPTTVGNLQQLTYLQVSNDALVGVIPSQIGNLQNLEILILDCNGNCNGGGIQSGTIPTEIGKLIKLSQLDMIAYQISGTIPSEIGLLTALTELVFGGPYGWGNSLVGTVPVELTALTNMQNLQIANNMLTGSLAPFGPLCSGIASIDFSCNAFTGPVSNNPCLAGESACTSCFTGSMPALSNVPAGQCVLNGCHRPPDTASTLYSAACPLVSAPLQQCTPVCAPTYHATARLNITCNSTNMAWTRPLGTCVCSSNCACAVPPDTTIVFSNSCPTRLNNTAQCTGVCVAGTAATGSLTITCMNGTVSPPAGQCLNQDMLGLIAFKSGLSSYGSATLTTWTNTTVPCSFSTSNWQYVSCNMFGRVTSLIMAGYSLSGTISPLIELVSQLAVLKLSSNTLQGTIPTQIGLLTNLVTLLLNSNRFSGTLPSQMGLLTQVTSVSVSNNALTGVIPTAVESLCSSIWAGSSGSSGIFRCNSFTGPNISEFCMSGASSCTACPNPLAAVYNNNPSGQCALPCGTLSVLNSTNSCGSTTASGGGCVTTCNTGWQGSSNPTASCYAGVWTVTGACTPSPCLATNGVIANSINTCPTSTMSGSNCSAYTCNVGWRGSSNPIATCLLGVWTLGSCTPTPCSTPPVIGNTSFVCSTSTPSGSACAYTCLAGYTAGASQSCYLGNWSSVGYCWPNSCATPANTSSTHYPLSCGVSMNSSVTCSPICAPGYYLNGSPGSLAITCYLGNLSAATGTCKLPPAVQQITPLFLLNQVITTVTVTGLYFQDVQNVSLITPGIGLGTYPCAIVTANATTIFCTVNLTAGNVPTEQNYTVAVGTSNNEFAPTSFSLYIVASLNLTLAYIKTNASVTPSLFFGPNSVVTLGVLGVTYGLQSSISPVLLVNGGVLSCSVVAAPRFASVATNPSEFDVQVPGWNNALNTLYSSSFLDVAVTLSVTVSVSSIGIHSMSMLSVNATATGWGRYIDPPTLQAPCPNSIRTDEVYNVSISAVNVVTSGNNQLTMCLLNGVLVQPATLSAIAVVCTVFFNGNSSNATQVTVAVTNVGTAYSSSLLTSPITLSLIGACKYTKANSISNDIGVCVCPQGTYDNAGVECLPCPDGTYQSEIEGETSSEFNCQSCPANMNTGGFTGSTSSDACVCQSGFIPIASNYSVSGLGFDCYCAAGTQYEAITDSCQSCPADSFSAAPILPQSAKSCMQCSSMGSYLTTNGVVGATSASACVCENNLVMETGGVCLCPAGYYFIPSGQVCEVCPANQFSTTPSLNKTCTACSSIDPFMTTNGTGQTSAAACQCTDGFLQIGVTCYCPAGSYFSGIQCSLCQTNYYSDAPSLPGSGVLCSKCPDPFMITVGPGASNTSDCLCSSGFVLVGNACQCPAGTYLVGTACIACPVDTYSDVESLNSQCTSCALYRTTNGATGQNSSEACLCNAQQGLVEIVGMCMCPTSTYFNGYQCAACLPNTYADTPSLPGDNAQSCQSCPAFMITNGTGASSQTQCFCNPSLGFVYSSTAGQCVCPAGMAYTGTLCTPCVGNTYKATAANTQCTACSTLPLGAYAVSLVSQGGASTASCGCPSLMSPNANGLCVCGPGSFYSTQTYSCQPCPVGTYSSSTSFQTSCSPCSALNLVTFEPISGNSNAFVTSPLQSNSSQSCTCLASFEVDGNGMCSCPPGWYLERLSTSCQMCPVGTFASNYSVDSLCSECSSLPVGLYSTTASAGGASPAACICQPGFVLDENGMCSCDRGYYYLSGTGCTPCVGNTFKSVVGLQVSCTPCSTLPLGPLAVSLVTSGGNSSSSCGCPGLLQPDPTTGACVCPPGLSYSGSLQSCQPCPVNTYSDSYSSEGCVSCVTVLGPYAITLSVGSTNASDCVCPGTFVVDPSGVCACAPGNIYQTNTQTCAACPADTYVEGYGTASTRVCESCSAIPPVNTRTTVHLTGQTSPEACVCLPGFFRSGTTCVACQAALGGSASCLGSDVGDNLDAPNNITMSGIVTTDGYWLTTDTAFFSTSSQQYLRRSSSSSSSNVTVANNGAWFLIARCVSVSACPGGVGDEICAVGYSGPICGVCADGYGRLGTSCALCPSHSVSVFLAAFIFVLTLLICFALVYISQEYAVKAATKEIRESVSNPRNSTSPIATESTGTKDGWAQELQLLGAGAPGSKGGDSDRSGDSSHHPNDEFQPITLTPPLDTGKNGIFFAFAAKTVLNHLQMLTYIGEFTTVWPEMFVKVFSIPGSAASVTSASKNIALDCALRPTLSQRAASYFLLPIVLVALVFAGFGSVSLWNLAAFNRKEYFSKVRRGVVVVLYMAHPGIIQGLFQILACNKVGEQRFSAADMSVNCASTKFILLRTLSVIYIIVYGFGLLVFVLWAMRRFPGDFVFLTENYRDERYYWDVWITLRKMILVFISLYASVSLQLFLGLWLLLLSWLGQHYLQPLKFRIPSVMEGFSLWVLIITASCGSLYYNTVVSITNSSGLTLSAFLILLNFFFILAVVYVGYQANQYSSGIIFPFAQIAHKAAIKMKNLLTPKNHQIYNNNNKI